MAEVLEAVMLICFGLSWPMNAYKNYKARTAAGTSWQFILLITLGYFAGIAAKFVSGTINWVLIVYFINVVCIAVNWAVYFRNRKLDEERGVIDAAESLKERRASRDRAVAAASNEAPRLSLERAHAPGPTAYFQRVAASIPITARDFTGRLPSGALFRIRVRVLSGCSRKAERCRLARSCAA